MVFSAVILVATGWLFVKVPKGFLPNEDIGSVFGFTEAQEGISVEAMSQHQQALAAVVLADPNVESFMSSYGARGGTAVARTRERSSCT